MSKEGCDWQKAAPGHFPAVGSARILGALGGMAMLMAAWHLLAKARLPEGLKRPEAQQDRDVEKFKKRAESLIAQAQAVTDFVATATTAT